MLAVDKPRTPASLTHPDFAIAAIAFDADGVCRFATPEARGLVAPRDPIGLAHAAVFAEWKSAPDLQAARGVSVACHADGRSFRSEVRVLPDGSFQLVLTDISAHVLNATRLDQDSLTGLLRRSTLKARLDPMIDEAKGAGVMVAVHHIDLDRFKSVNGSVGHAVGDTLLCKVAERLCTVLRPGDVAARLGGDEFALVQTAIARVEEAQACAERLVDLIGRAYVIQGHVLNIGASIGIALSDDAGADADMLLRHADLALYRAKAEGRGTARVFQPVMLARSQSRRSLEADLRLALAKRQFHLNFQPLYDLASDRITGFEALLRWTHPERGAVSPADFIPLAEEVGLIGPIGEWVLRTACREAMTWSEPATVAVNVSPHQFKDGRLVDTVVAALSATGLPPTRLEAEITEGALLDETNLVLRALNQLRELGVRISMDDFGTGYSSLSYIRKFPFDKIKIDQTFVRGLGIDDECNAICRAISTLGASLGIRTTAEGVETPDQLARIRQEGCTEVQGYLTGRPVAAADARALLERQKER